MTGGASRKVGWTWTARQGWKRIPRRLRTVKPVPLPKKRKTRKLRRISPAAPKPEKPDATEAQNLPVEQGRAAGGHAVASPRPLPRHHVLTRTRTRRCERDNGQIETPPAIASASRTWEKVQKVHGKHRARKQSNCFSEADFTSCCKGGVLRESRYRQPRHK
jgi:hypothetical protein